MCAKKFMCTGNVCALWAVHTLSCVVWRICGAQLRRKEYVSPISRLWVPETGLFRPSQPPGHQICHVSLWRHIFSPTAWKWGSVSDLAEGDQTHASDRLRRVYISLIFPGCRHWLHRKVPRRILESQISGIFSGRAVKIPETSPPQFFLHFPMNPCHSPEILNPTNDGLTRPGW